MLHLTKMCHSASGDNSSSPERDGQAADNNPVNQRLLSLQKQLDIELKVVRLDHWNQLINVLYKVVMFQIDSRRKGTTVHKEL